jgi:hypothetical protein
MFTFWASKEVCASMVPKTPAERVMLRQIASRGEVDLRSSPKGANVIRASFLWDVITSDKTRIENNGLWIIGADVTEDRFTNYEMGIAEQRRNLTVPFEIRFQNTIFEGTFSCIHCHFKGNLRFVNADFQKGIDLSESQIDGDLTILGNVEWLPDTVSPLKVAGIHVDGELEFDPGSVDSSTKVSFERTTAQSLRFDLTTRSSFSLLDLESTNTKTISIQTADSTVEYLDLQGAVVKDAFGALIDAKQVSFV